MSSIFPIRALFVAGRWAFFLFVVACCFNPGDRAHAATYPTFETAMATCVAYYNAHPPGAGSSYMSSCHVFPGCSSSPYEVGFQIQNANGSQPKSCFPFDGYVPPPGDTACISPDYPSGDINVPNEKILTGYSICARQKASDGSGATIMCQRRLEPLGAPTLNPYNGQWQTFARLTASASLCGSDAQEGKVKGKDGSIVNPGGDPIVPPAPGDPNNGKAPPQLCNGGSCYDPGTDQFCAISGGKQICVPGSTARGSQGLCVSSGDASVCAGSPSSPRPPPPPSSPISDPPSSIRSSDKTTQADKTTGQNQTVVTTVYAPPGVQVDNGSKPGDTTKPPENWCVTDETGVKHCIPKTDPGTSYCVTLGDGSKVCEPKDGKENDKGTASGGGDCNSPPVCSGDQPTCAVVDQQWLTRCKARFGEDASTGQPNWTKVGDGDGAQYATTDTPREAVIDDGTGSGEGSGPGSIDDTGFAGNTCPILPSFEVFGRVVSFDQDLFCRWLSLLRSIFLLVAAFIAARIIASGGKA